MKLLHAADLHLGLQSGGVSRRRDHERVLAEILGHVEAHSVDVLLIAGDIFNDKCDRELTAVASDFLKMLLPTLRAGTDVVLLPGNHDNLEMFRLLGLLLREVAGEDSLPLLVCHEPRVYELPHHGDLQVVALPYLPPNVLRSVPAFAGPLMEGADLNQTLAAAVENGLKWLEGQVDPTRPAIFAGHILVRGVPLTPGIEYGYAQGIAVAPQGLPHYTQYNALGHIHLCQEVKNASRPSWYAGAPDRQDRGERAYTPCVLLVDLTMEPGVPCEPIRLPIESATPYISESFKGKEEVGEFLAGNPRPETLGLVQIACPESEFSGLRQQLLGQCPSLTVEMTPVVSVHPTIEKLPQNPQDVRATVGEYLSETYTGEELIRLQEAFAELVGEAATHED